MKASPSSWILGAAGLMIGALVGRQFSPVAGATMADSAIPAIGQPERANGTSADKAAAAAEVHDFAALLKWRKRQQAGNPEIVRELERMDGPALRNLILEMMAAMPAAADEEKQSLHGLIEQAAKELFRRDGEKALEWASSIEGTEDRRRVLSQLISAAAHDAPELAKPWVDRFREEFGKDWASSFAHQAIIGATGRGAEDLLRLKVLYGDDLRGAAFPQGSYAEDFDFHRLISGLDSNVALVEAMQYWAAKDKEAAWAGVKEMVDGKGKGAGYFGSLFHGVAVVEGEGKAAAWIAPKLEELPDALRKNAIQSLRGMGRMSNEGVAEMMTALPQEADRVMFAAAFVSPHFGDGKDLIALRRLGSDASREDALVSVAAGTYRGGMHNAPPGHAEKVRNYFGTTVEQLGLSPEARERVMAALEPLGESDGR